MKKIIAIIAALSMCFAFCACGGQETIESVTDSSLTDGSNPLTSVTEEEFEKSVGMDLNMPEDADTAEWFIYTIDGTSDLTGEMRFVIDGKEYCERVSKTEKLKVEDFSEDEITTFTGMNYEWTDQKNVRVKNCDGTVYSCGAQDPAAVVVWVEAPTGFVYSLSTTDPDVSPDDLVKLANKIFEPAQDED